MAGWHPQGGDTTIALLLALIAHNDETKASALQRKIDAPRASFHRIVRTLTAAGILEAPRGLLRVGRVAEPLIEANAAAAKREDDGRAARGLRSNRKLAVSRTAEALDSGPIA